MAKRIDWDGVTRQQRAQRHGAQFAYVELPPAGSRADQMRYLAAKPKKQKKVLPSAKGSSQRHAHRVPTRDDRLHNLRALLRELTAIPATPRWIKKGVEYQGRLLGHIASTLNALLKLEPSASTEPTSLEATRILAQHSFGNTSTK